MLKTRQRWLVWLFLVGLLVVCACQPKTVVVERQITVEVEKSFDLEQAPEPAPSPPPGMPDSGGEGVSSLPMASPRSASRMIIKDAELKLLVRDTAVAIDRVTQVAVDSFGYIVSTRTWREGDHQYATITMGVPSEEYETTLRRLRGIALEVLDESASGTDVTDQYVDLQSRLRNLEATEVTIRGFLEKSATVEESLQVNRELSEITGQIEEIKGKMNYLKDRSSYSTITVHLEPERPTPTPRPTSTPEAWQPGKTLKSATRTSGRALRGFGDAVIWIVIVLGPYLVPLGLLVWLAVWVRRNRRERKGKNRAAESKPENEGVDRGAQSEAE